MSDLETWSAPDVIHWIWASRDVASPVGKTATAQLIEHLYGVECFGASVISGLRRYRGRERIIVYDHTFAETWTTRSNYDVLWRIKHTTVTNHGSPHIIVFARYPPPSLLMADWRPRGANSRRPA